MEGGRKKGRPFGQRRPTLTELIERILKRYPDGGQILKELIQNADDAGATEVKFLYDNRQHGTQSLQSPELEKFQGPALYCHNNATFKDEDWEGIQNLMRSNKKDDPLKVGSFGIGFNSVYHITDLPGIVSKETVGFLDPHETYFVPGESGQQFDIKDNLLDPSSEDQFMPFHGIFGCDLANQQTYDGTLFRFPLRVTPSDLSKKKYTKQMIDNLFESLREESSVILLFLKSVHSISVYERKDDGEIDCVFKVEVAEDTLKDVTTKRQEFLKEAKQSTITESSYVMNVLETLGSQTRSFRWLIVNKIGSNEERIAELAGELCLLPWIGLAVPMDDQPSKERTGRIFCFLPLPPDVDCQTGLPVHVHGYFGLTDNRRGLVWPGAECQNTQTAEWNELLLKKTAVEVYCKIIDSLVKNEPRTDISQELRRHLVYSSLPVLGNVQGHWKILPGLLFSELIHQNQKIFYAQQLSGNSWITLDEGILDRIQESSETREAILKILLKSAHVVITDLPPHVLDIVARYFTSPKDITPVLLRSVLKTQDISTTSREDKLLLLDFALLDDPTSDISGVPLLPLANGQFVKFSPNTHALTPSTSVFVPSASCTATLLPNMKDRFLDENLPEAVTKKLSAMAANGFHKESPTQLVRLTKEMVVDNLRPSLPPEWFNGCEKVQWIARYSEHPPESWLNEIWRWIHASFPDSLIPFQNIPLIELHTTTDRRLGVLSRNSKFIFASDGSDNTLPSQVSSLLLTSGCTVLPEVPSYLRHSDIDSYVAPPTPAGAVKVLSRASLEAQQEHVKQKSANDRCVFREFFCRLPQTLSIDQKNLLLQLPLFDTLSGSCTAAQVNGRILQAASSDFNLPGDFQLVRSEQIISSADPKACQLLTSLAVDILKPADVFVRYLFPDIRANSTYNVQETALIMLWILEQIFIFKAQSEQFHEEMEALPFVSTDEGQMKKPSELYDPNDDLLLNLFSEESRKFPTKDFAVANIVLTLKELGLRTRSMLTASELYGVAVSIASSPVTQSSIRKVNALVEILQGNLYYLNQLVDGCVSLKDKLLQLKWLPRAKHPPESTRFPKFMSWYSGNSSFFAPAELRCKSKILLVGSSMPILDVEMSDKLHDEFGLSSDPPVHHVVSQLKTASNCWQGQHQRTFTSKFQEMLVAIYLHLSQVPDESVSQAFEDALVEQWIWHGTGFCSPAQVALEKDLPLDLRPHLFLLPDDLKYMPSLIEFFIRRGVRTNFADEDTLKVLAEIRSRHARSSPEEEASKEVESDLKLCRSILEWFVEDGKTLTEGLQEKVLVPVQNPRNHLVLEPCKKCTYCDRDWLRSGGSELDIPGDYLLVHDSVPVNVARLLGVPPLSTCLLSAESLGFAFEQTGPYEPITTRLSNILKEYKEGVGVFKELIQNADDAGATKVRFLVDWRHGPKEKLLSPKMAECQGPALWAYNNAVFTDKDFENINKLAGATKVEDLAKIGRFGLGFNAVYHLTDVPSFVSREYLVIFDPNVHHLQSHIKDKSRPGIRINLATNPRPLSAFEDQFQPYHGVFDCNTQCNESEKFHCDGTLFRFPFRTLRQANESEICQRVYDEEKVKAIVSSLKESASLLLLYTQHVDDVELYELGNGNDPKMMQLVLSVRKNFPQHIRSGGGSYTVPFIKECSDWWRGKLRSEDRTEACPFRSELVTIHVNEMVSDLISNAEQSEKRETWLRISCVGTDSSVRLALGEGRKHGLLPCAGTAAKLSDVSDDELMNALKLIPEAVEGEAFCFLPLSIATGIPVHINGYFAITSNRRGIWERSTSDQVQPIEVQWNESLMEDALSNAYVHLLDKMKRLFEEKKLQDYSFYDLWPCYCTLQSSTWETLLKSFYSKLVKEALPLLRSNGKWLDIHSGYIPGEDLRKAPGALDTLSYLGENIFDLKAKMCSSLTKSGQDEILQNRTLILETFLNKFFFPNITRIPQELRDPIVCFGLDCILSGQNEFELLFKENACIACSADGVQLAKPCDLVNPNGVAACLFSAEDRRFPAGEQFLTDNRLYVLEQLGMVKDQLSWRDICERAKSVEELSAVSFERGIERVWNLMKYLSGNIEELPKESDEIVHMLQSTNFLPFMSKPPSHYGLPWKGSEHQKKLFYSPEDLFTLKDKNLVGSCFLIVDDSEDKGCGKIGPRVKQLLGFFKRRPQNDHVLRQLDATINAWSKMSEEERKAKKGMVESVCRSIYKHLDEFIRESIKKKDENVEMAVERLKAKLDSKTWLFVRSSFVSTEKVACDWIGNGAPFLYGLPEDYSTEYENLLKAAGVKKSFDKTDFINALFSLRVFKEGSALSDHELKIAVCFLNELKNAAQDLLKENADRLCLPDTNKVLCQSDELTINNTPWLKDRGYARYVHKDITPDLAFKLGAKSLQDRRLKKYSNTFGRPFGQHEKLTDRLKNILKAYRCDSGILKELVQNADDAQATEIHFIHDTRELSCERVFQKNAKEVQGPALCVYNNRPFSDKDLEGIQNLGIGSKSDDPETTGQSGIGFNAVYHLTDCPSFLSNNDTLCLFDPHCRYAPEATQEFPGEQFRPIDEGFKEDFADALSGYLNEHFKLRGSTMFRLPLRSRDRCQSSLISQTNANAKISSLLETFQSEAKKALLFLNHIKKISLSKIDDEGRLKRTYEVSSIMYTEDEKKRQNIFSLMKMYKNVPTCEVPWQGVTYPMILSESNRITEEWLVHQCLGVENLSPDDEIPDGRPYGLLPRAGAAAFVSDFCPQALSSYKQSHVAYCFLPLPIYTPLPVHVNGHFALDPSRRVLWQDTDPNKPLTKWNNFIKSHVLAPGYAALILEARHYMPQGERDPNDKTNCYFPSEVTDDVGLHWYHNLFPDLSETKDEWKTLAVAVYRFLGRTRAPVLPVVVADEADIDENPVQLPRRIRNWIPCQEGFFVERFTNQKPPWKVLQQIHLPLLVNSPTKIYDGFKEAEVTSCFISAERVINVLRTFHQSNSKCEIGDLPSKLEDTMVRGIAELEKLIVYCKTEKNFASLLIGLPLLLTADGKLRVFNTNNPVYCSNFSDLFPNRIHVFVHPKLVNDLSNTMMNDDDEPTPQVLRHLTVSSLASFIPDVVPLSMRAATKHMPYPDKCVFSKEWLKRLWKFLQYYAQPEESETQVSLKALGEWPIIPTTNEELVTIDNAKTVLDMTERGTEGPREKKIINFLRKLQCPSLDKDITFADLNVNESLQVTGYVSSSSYRRQGYADSQLNQKTTMAFPKLLNKPIAVTDPYVAHPNNVADVLQVLDYMRKTEILDEFKLTGDEMFKVLEFFQDDYENLKPKETYDKILKGLRLYKAINNAHYDLLSFSSYALVPGGVPVKEIEKLQRCTGCLFLHSDALPTLTTLYEGLGAGAKRTVSRFYEEYILPNFYIFSRESQIEYLAHIRDKVLPRFDETKEKQAFLDFLKDTRCIPGNDGQLHRVREFYDPRNSVFRIMLDDHDNQFPPSPFDDTEWLEFLADIGLKIDVGEREFLEYCRKIASDANRSRLGETTINRSKELVKYLLTDDHLREPQFLVSVSTIKFIASEKANPNLLSLHKQYQCEDESQHPPFLQFSNSVSWKYQKLVWTSAPLLPEYAQPDKELSRGLRFQESPSVDAVISHLQNISGSLAETSNKEEALPQPKDLKQIMKCIYDFFLQSTDACERDITNHCSQECKNIGNRLRSIPCILVEEEKVLVKGDKLSFDALLEKSLHPFLYAVPREYGNYDHILKRLGATEEITSIQMAKLFKTMKDRCKEGKINPNFEKKARKAMFLFFKSVFEESSGGKKESKISNLTELFLPSKDKRLIKSNELVCQVPPCHTQTVEKLMYHVLYSLEKCGLPRAQENEYLQALPKCLRPQHFGRIASERLDPSCLNSPCQLCQENPMCEFIEKHTTILKSKEFQNGIVRLLKHQKKANELTEDEMEKSSRLSSAKVQIKCMESIKVHLILRKTDHPLENSSVNRPCFVVNENDSWILYIRHDNGGKNKQSVLSKSVNKILDWLLTDECLLVVTDMLSCDSSSQITSVLNLHDIDRDFSEELKLGREVPIVFHYLMQQNPLFVFYEGEIVAFGIEMKEEQTEEEALDDVLEDEPVFVKYVLAEVITCVKSNRGGNPYDFEARYEIDLGNERKEVSVLDLYKFYQNDPDENLNRDMVPYTGDTSSKSTDIDDAKRKIGEALRAAWRLLPEMRRKVISRLYLRWHPDKNPNHKEFATEMMTFLLGEVKRMEKEERHLAENSINFRSDETVRSEYDGLFRSCNIRARQEQETFRNYRYFSGGSPSAFSGTSDYTYPDPREARRWLEQSRSDIEAAEFLVSATRPFNALACFLSHQIVEKSLKAALYAKCGLTNDQLHSHDVYSLAQNVSCLTGAPDKVVELALVAANYYLPTRYPNRQPRPLVPANAFSREQSTRAVQTARELLKLVERFTGE